MKQEPDKHHLKDREFKRDKAASKSHESNTPIDLSIVIVNYNGAKFITQCIESIFKSKTSYSYEIIIVDNQSQDKSLDLLNQLKAAHPNDITVIANTHNRGFSYANNQAFKIAKGRLFFMLNNDTVLKSDTLEKMIRYYDTLPIKGALAPKLLNADGTLQAPGSIFGQWRFRSKTPQKVPFIAGAAVLIDAETMKKIGYLDVNLFFYNDDIDFCKNLARHKFPIIYYPEAELTHFGGLSTQFRKLGSLVEGYRGGLYISKKHYGWLAHHLYRVILLIDLIPRTLFHILLGSLSKTHRDYAKAYLKVWRINFTDDIYVHYPE